MLFTPLLLCENITKKHNKLIWHYTNFAKTFLLDFKTIQYSTIIFKYHAKWKLSKGEHDFIILNMFTQTNVYIPRSYLLLWIIHRLRNSIQQHNDMSFINIQLCIKHIMCETHFVVRTTDTALFHWIPRCTLHVV